MLAWLPNALTVSRCVFAALVLFGALRAAGIDGVLEAGTETGLERQRLLTFQQLWHQFTLLAFLSGVITDFLDGWAARQFGAESRFGVWLDPIADKLLVAAALVALALALKSWLIYVPAALIIARDVFMTWLRTRPEAKGVVAPSNLAKVKTAIEMLAIAGLMLPLALWPAPEAPAGGEASLVGQIGAGALVLMLWAAAGLSLYTAAQYVRVIRRRT
ncbi:CDP-alcohol phosphatidyltransferase family protein [Hyphomonas sp.]|uniref:CDP-alcohol phosphatidyltransferase family protein n=1 Tax=Hyphomonas sp. TaxID=87 RepID=UPI00391D59D0